MDGAMDKCKNHYFSIKGEKAEGVIHGLAQKSFLIDWCYLNPVLPDGKELCDLLIVFDDIAIIWQIKDLKLDREGKYKKKDVEKNLRQLYGARRQLFALKTEITLDNPRRGKEVFDPESIKHIYLISALVGEGEEEFAFVENYKNHTVHVFNRDFTEIILNELDTISDFTKYLKAKEELIAQDRKIVINGGEEDLMAGYLLNDRSFSDIEKADLIIIDTDGWKYLENKPEYKAKQEANKISYGWDELINCVPEGQEEIARELARPNRFERRVLCEKLYEAQLIAHHQNHNNVMRRVIQLNNITYCFMFFDDLRIRAKMLEYTCYVAREKFDKEKVVGIATNMRISLDNSIDYCLLNMKEWGQKEKEFVEEIQQNMGIFVNPQPIHFRAEEYPSNNE